MPGHFPFAPARRWRAALLAAAVAVPSVVSVSSAAAGDATPSTSVPVATTVPPAPSVPAPDPSATTVPATPAPPALSWTTCRDRPAYKCATLRVPLDYAQPSGPTIGIALLKVPARQPKRRIGAMVVNPGGPGVSGMTFARQAANGLFGNRLLDRFDIVGFDPRGIGASAPVRCTDTKLLTSFLTADPDPDTPAEMQSLIDVSRSLAQGCTTRNSTATLAHVGTIDAARDLEQLRKALGDPGLTYFGFSYGTLLGLVYAQLYPTSIRALALDGILDPAASLDERTRRQAEGFERILTEYLADCDRTGCPFAKNGSARAGLDALLAQLETRPLVIASGADKGRTVGSAEAITGVLSALYSPKIGWPRLTDALRAATRGDGSGLLRLFDGYVDRNPDGTYLNTNDANLAVNCLDVPAPRTLAGFDALAARAAQVSPHFGRAAAFYSLPCAYWPVPAEGLPAVTAPGAPPILLVGNTGDPATPYAWAQRVADRVASAALLTNKASGHTAYISGGRCVRDTVEAYLVDRTVPAKGKTCS